MLCRLASKYVGHSSSFILASSCFSWGTFFKKYRKVVGFSSYCYVHSIYWNILCHIGMLYKEFSEKNVNKLREVFSTSCNLFEKWWGWWRVKNKVQGSDVEKVKGGDLIGWTLKWLIVKFYRLVTLICWLNIVACAIVCKHNFVTCSASYEEDIPSIFSDNFFM